MNSKWLEEYQRISLKTQFLSKLGTFLVFLFAFLSCWKIFDALYHLSDSNLLWKNILISITFHLIIGIIFGVRFVLLFFSSKRSFLIGQLFWLIGLFKLQQAGKLNITANNKGIEIAKRVQSFCFFIQQVFSLSPHFTVSMFRLCTFPTWGGVIIATT